MPGYWLLSAAVGSVLALINTPAAAESGRPAETEMCFGYNLAQDQGWSHTGCGGSALGSACGGSAERSRHPGRWKMVPAGTCKRIHGGTLTPPGSPDEKSNTPPTL